MVVSVNFLIVSDSDGASWVGGVGFPVGVNSCPSRREMVRADSYPSRKVYPCSGGLVLGGWYTVSCTSPCERFVSWTLFIVVVLVCVPRSPVGTWLLSLLHITVEVRRAAASLVLIIHAGVDVAVYTAVPARVTHPASIPTVVVSSQQ